MKINGALKPHQGASKQGSSPGAVLQKYRVKRYFKVNENVANIQPLNASGEKSKNFTPKDINNIKTIYVNNQQQQEQTTRTHQQLELKGNYDDNICDGINKSLSRKITSASMEIKTHNLSATPKNTTQSSVLSLTKAKAFLTNDLNKGNNQKNKGRPTTEAKIEMKNINRRMDSAFINITTRQNNNSKLIKNKIKKNKINNINCSEKGVEHREMFKNETSNSVNDQVSLNEFNENYNKRKISNKHEQLSKFSCIPKVIGHIILIPVILFEIVMFSIISKLKINFFSFTAHSQGESGNGTFAIRSKIVKDFKPLADLVGYVLSIMSRVLHAPDTMSFKTETSKVKISLALCMLTYTATLVLLPHVVVGDDGDTFFPTNGLETTTPEFDYASRGQKKFGDKCENTLECGFPGSICDPKKKSCQCTEDLPVTNHIDKCGKEAAVNESCFFNEQCEVKYFQTECRDQRCVCRFDMTPIWLKDGSVECKGRGDKKGPETYIDPAMIGVLIGMALMFIIICVVLRLFSQARWRENRTIFNTPNPRLMNVSLLRESKLLHGQERRGSRMSVRAPSRQPSMASLRPHSPNPSLGKAGSRSNSHGSNASATSLKSTRSNSVSPAGIVVGNNSHHERKGSTYQPHHHQQTQQQKLQSLQQQEQQPLTQTNIISNPVAETVTVEIIEPEK